MKNMEVLSNHYFKKHPLNPRSGAGFVYMQLTMPPRMEKEMKEEMKDFKPSEKDKEDRRKIEAADDKDALFRLMRTPMIGANRDALRHKLLDYQEDMMPLIKKRLLTTKNDSFIDDSIWFLGHCKENPTGWILENYSSLDDHFIRSQLCVVLGIRGDVNVVPFLMEQEEFYETENIKKGLEQGPLFGLRHMWARIQMAQKAAKNPENDDHEKKH